MSRIVFFSRWFPRLSLTGMLTAQREAFRLWVFSPSFMGVEKGVGQHFKKCAYLFFCEQFFSTIDSTPFDFFKCEPVASWHLVFQTATRGNKLALSSPKLRNPTYLHTCSLIDIKPKCEYGSCSHHILVLMIS